MDCSLVSSDPGRPNLMAPLKTCGWSWHVGGYAGGCRHRCAMYLPESQQLQGLARR